MNYDFVIIGGGSAGYAAARTATHSGLRTAVIEGGQEVAGLCILRGCMPSKTLIETAQRYRTLRRAKEFGLRAEKIAWSGPEIIARKQRLIKEFADYRREQLETGGFELLRGTATFLDPHTVSVEFLNGNTEKITASTFLIATGSVIRQPSIPGLAEAKSLTSDDLLNLEQPPASLLVLGAGPVALELAHYLEALGTKVVIIQRGKHFLTGSDYDIADTIQRSGEERGIRTYVDTELLEIRVESDGSKIVSFKKDGKVLQEKAAEVFNALGREPAIGGLGLDKVGVECQNGKIQTASTQQTSVPHIFAAGDAAGPYEIVHIAIQQGEIAARNASRFLAGASSSMETMDYRILLYVVFTEPEAAFVGLSEQEARQRGIPFISSRHYFNDHGKSLVMGETVGFVKLLASPDTKEILGGAVVGPHASDLIHEIAVALYFRATATQLASIPHYHPTLSEIWSYPAEELAS
ncbi:MAG: dihydrolipoamide dehydrogenase [Verrucomicrobia bacterium]|nr:MAG: dihydrolipoamide dehydrogenase [Verrucomicrobiota bacterium]